MRNFKNNDYLEEGGEYKKSESGESDKSENTNEGRR